MQCTTSKIQFSFIEIVKGFGVISAKHSNASQADLIQQDTVAQRSPAEHAAVFREEFAKQSRVLAGSWPLHPLPPQWGSGAAKGFAKPSLIVDYIKRIYSGIKILTLPQPGPRAHLQVSSPNSQPHCSRPPSV